MKTVDLMQKLKESLAAPRPAKPSLAERPARFRFERVSSHVVEEMFRTHEVWTVTDVTVGNSRDNPHCVVFRAGYTECTNLGHTGGGQCHAAAALLSHKLSLACVSKDES